MFCFWLSGFSSSSAGGRIIIIIGERELVVRLARFLYIIGERERAYLVVRLATNFLYMFAAGAALHIPYSF